MKKILTGILLFLCLVAFAACGQSGEATTEAKEKQEPGEVNLRIALFCQKDEPTYKAVEQFVSEITARSKGAIQAEILLGKDAGSEQEIVDAFMQKAAKVDVAVINRDILAKYEPKMNISALPYLFADYDEALQFLHGEVQEDAQHSLTGQNMKVLAHYAEGFECLTLNTKEMSGVKNLQGLAIAVTDGLYHELAMKVLGASAGVESLTAVKSKLGQNRYDGFAGKIETICDRQIYQNQKSVVVTNHGYSGACFVIDCSLFEKLSKEQQDILEKAAVSSAYAQFEKVKQEDKRMLKQMESAGIRIYYPDLKSFWEKSQAVVRSKSSEFGSLADRIIAWKNGR